MRLDFFLRFQQVHLHHTARSLCDLDRFLLPCHRLGEDMAVSSTAALDSGSPGAISIRVRCSLSFYFLLDKE